MIEHNSQLPKTSEPQSSPTLLDEAQRIHILYSENLAHSDLKDRTLASY